jgi:protein TonB
MQTQAILQANYLDIVFDNRNKLYGGYELRTHYQRRMTTAIVSLLVTCLILGAYGLLKKQQQTQQPVPAKYKEIEITRIETPSIEVPKIIPTHPTPPPQTNTAKLTPPVITPDDMVKPNDLPADVKQLQNANAGSTTHFGVPSGISGTIDGPKTTTGIVAPPAADTKPFVIVEQMPEFQGDMIGYLSKQLIYPAMARDNNIQGKVIVQFVVNEDGSVSNAKVMRGIGSGCDAEALRVVNGMPKWKPGKQNGKAVKVYYTLPIRFLLG